MNRGNYLDGLSCFREQDKFWRREKCDHLAYVTNVAELGELWV